MSLAAEKSSLPTPASPRLDSIDMLRGIVMVVMALDHTRGYFSLRAYPDPVDLEKTFPALFLTRWITHFCAPVFVFLAGTGAFLSGTRGKTTAQLSWFLLTRGLWLVFLELTLVRLGWTFSLDYHAVGIGVIWAIGWSMVVLAGLVYLPISAIVVFGVSLIALHNAFDGIKAKDMGEYGWLWAIAHTGEPIVKMSSDAPWQIGGPHLDTSKTYFAFFPGYPLIPWIGVLAAGYGFAALYLLEARQRASQLLGLGLSLTAVFIVMRYLNVYGDLHKWHEQPRADASSSFIFSLLAFLNCHKYPPSLDYLLMTLGPAIAFLGLYSGTPGSFGRFFITFGRVPLFFYLLHIPLIHATARCMAYLRYGDAVWNFSPWSMPEDYGYELPVVYLFWIGIVLALFPLCYWFAGVKRRHRDVWWLSYL
jgi:uncharacterized membrane protein